MSQVFHRSDESVCLNLELSTEECHEKSLHYHLLSWLTIQLLFSIMSVQWRLLPQKVLILWSSFWILLSWDLILSSGSQADVEATAVLLSIRNCTSLHEPCPGDHEAPPGSQGKRMQWHRPLTEHLPPAGAARKSVVTSLGSQTGGFMDKMSFPFLIWCSMLLGNLSHALSHGVCPNAKASR